jgi:RNA polymerase sigma factor (sigma-70 family)
MNLARSRFRRLAIERRARGLLEHAAAGQRVEPTDESVVAVRTAIAQLPPRQREVVLLRYFADLSVQATAEVMGCAEGTVKASTHKALATLATLGLRDEEPAGA